MLVCNLFALSRAVENRSLWAPACGQSVDCLTTCNSSRSALPVPSCPSICPVRAICTFPYDVRCIKGHSSHHDDADACEYYDPISTFDNRTNTCSVCNVGACAKCGRNGTCKVCLAGFTLKDDGRNCTDNWSFVWIIVYVVLTIALIIIVVYIVTLLARPTRNTLILEWAKQYRRNLVPTGHGWCFWRWHNDHKNQDHGIGVVLFFNFYLFGAVCAAVTAFGHLLLHLMNPQLKLMTHTRIPNLRCSIGKKAAFLESESLYATMFTEPMVIWNTAIYIILTILSFAFVLYQRWAYQRFDETHKTLSDFALLLDGLNPSKTAFDVENAIEDVLGQKGAVVGVSLAFGTPDKDGMRITQNFRKLVDSLDSELPQTISESEEGCHPLGCFDMFFCEEPVELEQGENDMQSVGAAIVVFASEELRNKILRKSRKVQKLFTLHRDSLAQAVGGRQWGSLRGTHMLKCNSVQMPRDLNPLSEFSLEGHALTVRELHTEPKSIIWTNFCLSDRQVVQGFLRFWRAWFSSILIFLLLYVPYLAWVSQQARIEVDQTSSATPRWSMYVQNAALGVLIGIGNANIANHVIENSKCLGSVCRDRQDVMCLLGVFGATLVSMMLDVLVTLKWMTPAYIAHFRTTNKNLPLPTDEAATGYQLWSLLHLGYLIIPYVMEPIVGIWLPWFSAFHVIRSRAVSGYAAARSLACPNVDLIYPYSDLVLNYSLCGTILFLISERSWQLYAILFLNLFGRYLYFSWSFTHYSSKCAYTTDRLALCALALLGVPMSMMSCVSMYWVCRWYFGLKLAPLGLPEGPREWTDTNAQLCLILFSGLAGIIHILCYLAWVFYGSPLCLRNKVLLKLETTSTPLCGGVTEYEKAVKEGADYFNTNPGVVLLSHTLKDAPLFGKMCLPRSVRKMKGAITPLVPGRRLRSIVT